jgi:hypothetical protein
MVSRMEPTSRGRRRGVRPDREKPPRPIADAEASLPGWSSSRGLAPGFARSTFRPLRGELNAQIVCLTRWILLASMSTNEHGEPRAASNLPYGKVRGENETPL